MFGGDDEEEEEDRWSSAVRMARVESRESLKSVGRSKFENSLGGDGCDDM